MDLSLLSFTDWTLITLGSALSFTGLGIFYCGLRLPEQRRSWLLTAGSLITLAYCPWILSANADRLLATATALLMTTLLTCIGFACKVQRRNIYTSKTTRNWPDRSRAEAIQRY